MSTLTVRRQPGSLPLAVARHLLGAVAGVGLLWAAGAVASIEAQPMLWVGAAAVAGGLAGLVDRGWLGLVFVEVGLVIGVAAQLFVSHHGANEAAAALAAAAWLYLAVLLAGAAAYLILRLVRRQLS